MRNINSPDNQVIKDLVKMRKGAFAKKNGLFLIDGRREIEMAFSEKIEIEEVFLCPELAKENDITGLSNINIKKTILTRRVFEKVAYKENPDGFLALAKRRYVALDDIKLKSNPLIIVLEEVEKPGNLGAIIRTAVAAGVDLIILNNQQTDIFSANVIRASEGLIFSLPLVSRTINETFEWLKNNKIKTLAAATGAKKDYCVVDMSGAVALVFGSEAQGLSEEWLSLADEKIKIPMKSGVDSLNISVSAGILAFEVIRQRRIKNGV